MSALVAGRGGWLTFYYSGPVTLPPLEQQDCLPPDPGVPGTPRCCFYADAVLNAFWQTQEPDDPHYRKMKIYKEVPVCSLSH